MPYKKPLHGPLCVLSTSILGTSYTQECEAFFSGKNLVIYHLSVHTNPHTLRTRVFLDLSKNTTAPPSSCPPADTPVRISCGHERGWFKGEER